MRFELELIRSGIRGVFASPVDARRELRLTSDAVIHEALKKNDLAYLYVNAAKLMLVVARVTDQYEHEPELTDFVEAAQALIEQGRGVLDRGLTIDSKETTRCGIVMIELAVRGIAQALDIPYEPLMKAVHGGAGVEDITPTAEGEQHADDTVRAAEPGLGVADPV